MNNEKENKNLKKAVYAGTFDPVTDGHVFVLKKASELFDEVYLALCVNPKKTPLFSVDKRMEMLKAVSKNFKNVTAVYHGGMLVDFMKSVGALYSVRGVRNDTDYNYENEMHFVNQKLYPEMTTIFIPSDEETVNVSSTRVKEMIKSGEDLKGVLPEAVIEIINGYEYKDYKNK